MKRIMVVFGIGIIFSALVQPDSIGEMPQLVSSSIPSPVVSSNVSWHTTLESGWAESRRLNLPMVIYISAERCTYCDAMKHNTWCDRSVQQDLANGFVAISLTREQNSSTLDRIHVETYPTTLIGIPKGKIIAHRNGYQPVTAMKELLSEAKHRIVRGRP